MTLIILKTLDIILTPYYVVTGMSTPVCSEAEIVQADGAQDSRVPASTCTDPCIAVRQQIASSIDSESEPEEAPFEPEDTPDLSVQLGAGPASPTHLIPPAGTPSVSPVRVSCFCGTARMTVCTQPSLPPGYSARLAEAAALSPTS